LVVKRVLTAFEVKQSVIYYYYYYYCYYSAVTTVVYYVVMAVAQELVLVIWFGTEFVARIWSAGYRSRYRGISGRLLFVRRPLCIVGTSTPFSGYKTKPHSRTHTNCQING